MTGIVGASKLENFGGDVLTSRFVCWDVWLDVLFLPPPVVPSSCGSFRCDLLVSGYKALKQGAFLFHFSASNYEGVQRITASLTSLMSDIPSCR